MNEFKIGDVVELKSGGPLMTVIESKITVMIFWFDVDNLSHDARVPPESLRLIRR